MPFVDDALLFVSLYFRELCSSSATQMMINPSSTGIRRMPKINRAKKSSQCELPSQMIFSVDFDFELGALLASRAGDCSKNSPQCLHFLATASTDSPQNGQSFDFWLALPSGAASSTLKVELHFRHVAVLPAQLADTSF
jgi:hypothetical protein